MLLVYKDAVCPICKGHHDFYVEEQGFCRMLPAHDFVCPTTGRRTYWRPDVFAHPVKRAPKEAIPLMPHESR
jgi:hypothetical protein